VPETGIVPCISKRKIIICYEDRFRRCRHSSVNAGLHSPLDTTEASRFHRRPSCGRRWPPDRSRRRSRQSRRTDRAVYRPALWDRARRSDAWGGSLSDDERSYDDRYSIDFLGFLFGIAKSVGEFPIQYILRYGYRFLFARTKNKGRSGVAPSRSRQQLQPARNQNVI
jgi:hypothetical protein